jgi:putative ABC transport system permease protein
VDTDHLEERHEDHVVSLLLSLRGIWWRRGVSAAVFAVATLTMAVAAIGPIYARATSQSTLGDELRGAASAAGLAFSTQVDLSQTSSLYTASAHVPPAGTLLGHSAPIVGLSRPAAAAGVGRADLNSTTIVWRSDQCRHLAVLSGRCPTRAGEAMVDDGAVTGAPRWRLGQTLGVTSGGHGDGELLAGTPLGKVVVVGTYLPRRRADPYWFGHDYFSANATPAVTSASPGSLNVVFVDAGEFATLPVGTSGEADLDFPVDPGRLRWREVSSVRAQVRALLADYAVGHRDGSATALRTGLLSVLAQADKDRTQIQRDTLLITLQLALLGGLVLFRLVSDTMRARTNEIALARLRGLNTGGVLRFMLAEPVVLVVLAVPVGLALGLLTVRALALVALAPGTPVVLTTPALQTVALALLGAVLASCVVAARISRRGVAELLRATGHRPPAARFLAVVESLAATAAILALLWIGHRGGAPAPGYLLAPAIFVLAAALVGVRVIPAFARLALPPTRARRHIALFLSLRQTVRRPDGFRLAALLAVAAGLATFGVAGETVAQGNRIARARTELGAPRVLEAQFGLGHDPQQIVAAVDPAGRWAMASATWQSTGGVGAGELAGGVLAVQPGRFSVVSPAVRGQRSPGAVAAAISGQHARTVRFVGARLRLRLTAANIRGDGIRVAVVVRDTGGQRIVADSSALLTGERDYVASVPCAAGCAFGEIVWDTAAGSVGDNSGSVTVRGIAASTDGVSFAALPVRLDSATAWRPAALGVGATSTIRPEADGLAVSFASSGGSSAILAYADSTVPIPVAATPAAVNAADNEPGGLGAFVDSSGDRADFLVRTITHVLPVVEDLGVVADLDELRRQLPDFDREAQWSVWLGNRAPTNAVQLLQRAGLVIGEDSTVTGRVRQLGRQAPALSLLLLTVCSVAATILAIGGTSIALAATARRRSYELAALHAVGVRRGALLCAAVLEQLFLLGAAVGIGVPAGYAAARLVMPLLAPFSDSSATALRFTPRAGPVFGVAGIFAALLVATAAGAGLSLARAANPERLREVDR